MYDLKRLYNNDYMYNNESTLLQCNASVTPAHRTGNIPSLFFAQLKNAIICIYKKPFVFESYIPEKKYTNYIFIYN